MGIINNNVHLGGKQTISGDKTFTRRAFFNAGADFSTYAKFNNDIIVNGAANFHNAAYFDTLARFTGGVNIYFKNITAGTAPSSTMSTWAVRIEDKNSQEMAANVFEKSTANAITYIMRAKRNNGAAEYAQMVVSINNSGAKKYEFGQATNNSSYIKIPRPGYYGSYITIQRVSGNSNADLTFPVPFSTYWGAVVSTVSDSALAYPAYISTHTNTTIHVLQYAGSAPCEVWAIGITA